MNFDYTSDVVGFDHEMSFNTLDGLEIRIGFDGLDPTHVYLNGEEHDLKSDTIKGLCADVSPVLLKSDYRTIAAIVNKAACLIEDYVREERAEIAAEERHKNSFRRLT